MNDVVHLGVKHVRTKKVGTWASPLEEVSTACRANWTTRPRRALLPSLVDCDACKLFIAAHQIHEDWAFPKEAKR